MTALTVATLNLFNNAEGRWKDRAPLVATQLVELAPDVMALQEVDVSSDQVPELLAALNGAAEADPYTAVTMANPRPRSIKSLAVLSRLPVLSTAMVDDLGSGDIALHVGIDAGGGRTLQLFTTHLHFGPSRAGGEIRLAQARRLLAWVEERTRVATAEEHVVLCGDFNARPGGETVALVRRHLRSAHEVANGSEPAWTHPTPLVHSLDVRKAFGVPKLPEGGVTVDYVFVGTGVDVLQAWTTFDRPSAKEPTLYPSDHLGVAARISLH